MTSPGLTVREGFSCAPFMEICPFLQAAAAIERVLKMRAAHGRLALSSLHSYVLLLLVELVHGNLDTGQTETFYHFASQSHPFVHGFQVLFRELSQYEADLSAPGEIVTDAEPQTGVSLCT